MCSNKTTFAIVLTLNLLALVQVQGCKLYCIVCPSDVESTKYYCCMEDWEYTPSSIRSCEQDFTTSSTSTNTPTPCPTLPPSPIPNRCPELGTPSPNDCEINKRLHPNPTICFADTDCTAPFNVCCEDKCFPTRICKIYMTEFGG